MTQQKRLIMVPLIATGSDGYNFVRVFGLGLRKLTCLVALFCFDLGVENTLATVLSPVPRDF